MPTLEWLTRKTDITADARVPYRLLEEVPELSCTERDPATENMLIQGDNLEALKSLLPIYAGKIKCIFIDPPYNTKSAFEHYDDNLEHSQWLAMMYPRLVLLRELLVEDGIFFVVLDDREIHYLKVICDEIFGRKNFCGSLVWEKKKKPSFLNANMGIVTDYILAYAKNRGGKPTPFVFGTTTADKMTPLNNAGNAEKILKFPAGRVEFGCSDQTFEPQDMSEGNIKTKLLDIVVVENGRNRDSFRLWGEWRYSQTKLNEVVATEDSLWISKSPFRPNHIKGGGAPKKLKNLLSKAHYDMASNEDATKESIALFGETSAFDYPKPEMLAQVLIAATTESTNDIILDSFLGSGTTAAVAHKMGRRYIGIEMGEHAITHCVPRLRKVVEGEQGGISKLVQPFATTELRTPA